jgi:hypothetical protein
MAFWKETYLNDRRSEVLRSIKRVQYQTNNSEWRDGEINSKEITGSDVVIFVNVPSSGVADTITGVRVYDINDRLAGEQKISLQRKNINAALLRFTFPLVEE